MKLRKGIDLDISIHVRSKFVCWICWMTTNENKLKFSIERASRSLQSIWFPLLFYFLDYILLTPTLGDCWLFGCVMLLPTETESTSWYKFINICHCLYKLTHLYRRMDEGTGLGFKSCLDTLRVINKMSSSITRLCWVTWFNDWLSEKLNEENPDCRWIISCYYWPALLCPRWIFQWLDFGLWIELFARVFIRIWLGMDL